MQIVFTVVGMEKLLKKIDRTSGFIKSARLRQVLEDHKNLMVYLAKNQVPRRSWLLHSQIKGEVVNFGGNNPGIKIGAPDSKYARWVEEGTKTHPISARNKKWLRWVTQGPRGKRVDMGWPVPKGLNEVFKKTVQHPETPPKPFIRPAVTQVKPRLLAAIVRALNEEIDRSGS